MEHGRTDLNGRPRGSTLQVVVVMIGVLTATSVCAQNDPARDLVNPFIGTGGHGHTFPGACVPNGLVQLSPDTRPDGYNDWDGAGGYHYSDSVIHGFSHTHLSGTGVSDLCDVLLMPMSGQHSFDPRGYRSSFRKDTEKGHAGYYRVHLEDHDVDVELTATKRTGLHRYHFPSDQDAWVILDLEHRDALTDHKITVLSNDAIQGMRRSRSWAGDQWLFFVIEFSRPFKQNRLDPAMTRMGDVIDHRPTKGAFQFAPSTEPLIVKVGISAVSIEGARKNLEAEVPHWDFDRVRAEAEAAWNTKLNKITVEGGTREQQRIFYTALYHSYVAPYIFNDVDGQYRGMDGQVHHAGHNVYTVFSLWDTFRSLHPLMTILEPDMTSDWIKTFLLHYQQGGRLPVWELWGNETDCMIGYHSVSVIADAYLKGIRGFDADLALGAMVHTADLDHFGLEAYKRRGYISSEDAPESVSRTLEYAYDDACIAAMARALGKKDIAARFEERSNSWQHLFDPGSGFFRPRRNGGFIQPFDPYEVNFHFTEANAWHYSLFAPHNIERLSLLHTHDGGLEGHLDRLFSANTTTTGRDQSDITGLIGQYAHGNEPSHHVTYLYNRVGRPDKTRGMLRRILAEQYHDAPDGLSGNEDCGQMSAWYVLSALGLHPMAPGVESFYELGYPLFDVATVHLPNARTWTIRVEHDRAPDPSTGMRHPTSITHTDLMTGGAMFFGHDRTPFPLALGRSTELTGTYVSAAPPPVGAPVIQSARAAFADTLEILVSGRGTCHITDGPGQRNCPMNAPFTIRTSSTIRVDWHEKLAPVEANFSKFDGNRSLTLESTYANEYSAGGENALIDGLRGGNDFRTGEWQGFRGQDLQATIDLGRSVKVSSIGLSVLQDQKSWIWFPSEVEFAFSVNGRQWSTVRVSNTAPRDKDGTLTTVMAVEQLTKRARYIKVIARNAGPCPPWHPGNGGSTWIFADEVLIRTE